MQEGKLRQRISMSSRKLQLISTLEIHHHVVANGHYRITLYSGVLITHTKFTLFLLTVDA